jgi:hypothetical protein
MKLQSHLSQLCCHANKSRMCQRHSAMVLQGNKRKSIGVNETKRMYSVHAEQSAIINYLNSTGRRDLLKFFRFDSLLSEKGEQYFL